MTEKGIVARVTIPYNFSYYNNPDIQIVYLITFCQTFILFLFWGIIYIEVIIKYYLCGESLHDNTLLTIQ